MFNIKTAATLLIEDAIRGSRHMNREVYSCSLELNAIKVFIDIFWISNASPSDLGFVIIDNDSKIILAGTSQLPVNRALQLN